MQEVLLQTSAWLEDLLQQGLAREEVMHPTFWYTQAARMVDAKAPGLARRFRRISTWPAGDPAWAPMLLAELGRLHLLLGAAGQYAGLPAEMQQDLDLYLKPNPGREKIMKSTPPVPDTWQVLGLRRFSEPSGPQQRLRVAETWLGGAHSSRLALHLAFAHTGRSAEPPVELGALGARSEPGLAAHFLSAGQPRVLFREAPEFTTPRDSHQPGALPWMDDFAAVDASLGEQLQHAPWLEQHPFLLSSVTPLTDAEAGTAGCHGPAVPFPARRWVADARGACRPVSPLFPARYWWQWLAVTRERDATGVFALLDPIPYVYPVTLWDPAFGGARSFS